MSYIKIEKKPYSRTEHFSGTYTTDISDTDDEAMIRDYDFTLEVVSDFDNDTLEVEEIVWLDDEPPAKDVAEDKIRENFFDSLL
jgi:hypothetical protein